MNEVTKKDDRRRTLVPATRVAEDNGRVLVWMELPGVSQGDLEIRVEGQELTVTGRRQDPATHGTWLLRERPWGDYQKTFAVDGSIDLDKIDAQLAQGILTLSLPMKEAAKPKRIEIRSA
jgi:HSP20 family protein